MKSFVSIPLKYKLPLIVVGMCIVTGVLLEIVNQRVFSAAIEDEAQLLAETTATNQAEALERWLQDTSDKAEALAIEPSMAGNIRQLAAVFGQIANPEAMLRPLYGGAGQPAGVALLPEELARYQALHAPIHDYLSRLAETVGFHDIILDHQN